MYENKKHSNHNNYKNISERGHIKNIYHALIQESIVNFINLNPYICRFVPIYFITSSFMPLPICKLNKLTFTSKNAFTHSGRCLLD